MSIANRSENEQLITKKRVYIKPVLKQVVLSAEESVLANCKTGVFSGLGSCQSAGDPVCVRAQTS